MNLRIISPGGSLKSCGRNRRNRTGRRRLAVLPERTLTFDRNPANILAVCLLRMYGVFSRPFGYKWLAWVGMWVGTVVKRNSTCIVQLNRDTLFRFYLADYYWSKLVCQGFSYEPEIERVLKATDSLDYLFLDLGANFGYWSVLVSSSAYSHKTVVAVEPVKSNFDSLCLNNKLNDCRFTAIRGAVCEQGGRLVRINVNPGSLANEAASALLKPEYALSESESVESVSIDQLVSRFAAQDQPIVIKLDVEGLEIEAIKGAQQTLRREFLLIYEDHGNDPDSAVSQFVLDSGFSVFHLEFGEYTPVTEVRDVNSIKTSSNKGYNLFAYQENSKTATLIQRAFSTS